MDGSETRYDTSGIFLRSERCAKIVMRKIV